jgi:hypothetical protein
MDVTYDGLKEYLKGTEWASDEAIARALQHFDKNAKKKVRVTRLAMVCGTNGAISSKGLR